MWQFSKHACLMCGPLVPLIMYVLMQVATLGLNDYFYLDSVIFYCIFLIQNLSTASSFSSTASDLGSRKHSLSPTWLYDTNLLCLHKPL